MNVARSERAKRRKLRLAGADIPKFKPGVKAGYKQTQEHALKRRRFGSENHEFRGDNVCENSGRQRAEALFPLHPCDLCGEAKTERHHKDGDTLNNSPENIAILCRKCHMETDGRLAKTLYRNVHRIEHPRPWWPQSIPAPTIEI